MKPLARWKPLSVRSALRRSPHRLLPGCAAVLLSTLPGPLTGQVMTSLGLGDRGPENVPPRVEPATPDTSSESPTVTEQATAVSPEARRLHYGLSLDLRTAYDDNILLSATEKIGDFNLRLDPKIAISFGDESGAANVLHFSYEPDIVLFFDHSEFDTFQHIIRFDATSNLGRSKLELSENAQFLKGTDVNQASNTGAFVNAVNLDVRGRPKVNTFDTQFTASYDLTGKTFLSGGVQWSVTDYSSFISSQRISGNLFANYAYGPKLVIGIGGSIGSEIIDQPTPDQTFEQINLRVSYELTGKLLSHAAMGIEIRQLGTGQSDYVSPVFDFGVDYTPFDGTIVSLAGSRKITNSASLAGQDFSSTELIVSVRQRLLQRFYPSLTGGYQNQSYFGAIGFISSNREDNYYFIQPAIDVRITRFWYAGGYYLLRKNDSSASIFGFEETQAGIRATLTF
jgi:hypothetical protein